jgi:hypothetical protein
VLVEINGTEVEVEALDTKVVMELVTVEETLLEAELYEGKLPALVDKDPEELRAAAEDPVTLLENTGEDVDRAVMERELVVATGPWTRQPITPS